MSGKLAKSDSTFFQNTMRMVNFTNRLKENNDGEEAQTV